MKQTICQVTIKWGFKNDRKILFFLVIKISKIIYNTKYIGCDIRHQIFINHLYSSSFKVLDKTLQLFITKFQRKVKLKIYTYSPKKQKITSINYEKIFKVYYVSIIASKIMFLIMLIKIARKSYTISS